MARPSDFPDPDMLQVPELLPRDFNQISSTGSCSELIARWSLRAPRPAGAPPAPAGSQPERSRSIEAAAPHDAQTSTPYLAPLRGEASSLLIAAQNNRQPEACDRSQGQSQIPVQNPKIVKTFA